MKKRLIQQIEAEARQVHAKMEAMQASQQRLGELIPKQKFPPIMGVSDPKVLLNGDGELLIEYRGVELYLEEVLERIYDKGYIEPNDFGL